MEDITEYFVVDHRESTKIYFSIAQLWPPQIRLLRKGAGRVFKGIVIEDIF